MSPLEATSSEHSAATLGGHPRHKSESTLSGNPFGLVGSLRRHVISPRPLRGSTIGNPAGSRTSSTSVQPGASVSRSMAIRATVSNSRYEPRQPSSWWAVRDCRDPHQRRRRSTRHCNVAANRRTRDTGVYRVLRQYVNFTPEHECTSTFVSRGKDGHPASALR